MSFFLIQDDDNVLDIEEHIVENILKRSDKFLFEYEKVKLTNLEKYKDKCMCIPIGTIEFVTKYLQLTEKFSSETPIEIPIYLQTDEFLKRKYEILTWDKIPHTGRFFLKDVSKLKSFSNIINADLYDMDQIFNYEKKNKFDMTLVLDKDHLYQVSDILNIKSEYRVYVIGNKIESISHYDGDPTLLPDIKLIEKANLLIEYNEKWLKSYTIDIAVGDFGTALLEIHNFTSVGLYSTLWGQNLLYAYRDGIQYLLHDNIIKCLKGEK